MPSQPVRERFTAKIQHLHSTPQGVKALMRGEEDLDKIETRDLLVVKGEKTPRYYYGFNVPDGSPTHTATSLLDAARKSPYPAKLSAKASNLHITMKFN